ncbi:MAG TPA: DNA mismatch repair protein MutS [Chloroflexota bacterium]|nr:DNA mismatch repair protein MutS [Chloroflexota bacterium]
MTETTGAETVLQARSLRVSSNKVFGYYIEVSNANRDLVPSEYIRKQTLVGAERYITPELKEREALILSADERRIALETSLLAQLRETIAAQAPRLLRTAESLAGLDVYAGLATVAVERDYVRPELDEGTRIEITGGRHPVVEVTQRETPFVPNDATLDAAREQIIILTGPNMSGKSCYLRQTALITLLAQIGSFVPAERARVGLVDRIFTRVGAQDDIATGHSTFMVEMVETATILSSCTPRSLLILDEVGRGTSTYDGVAIAQAIVEHLHDTPRRAAKTIFATHYHELNSLAERLSRVRNYRMDVLEEGDEVVFLRKVVPGGADKSYGIYVAELAGLPREVVRRARQILRELERKAAADRAALDSLQLSFFAPPLDDAPTPVVSQPNGAGGPDGALSALIAELAGLDVDNMTPLQALTTLARLRERARIGDGDV